MLFFSYCTVVWYQDVKSTELARENKEKKSDIDVSEPPPILEEPEEGDEYKNEDD